MEIKATILLVENDYTLTRATASKLEEYGYSVIQCANAETASILFKRYAIDLCILEMALPGRNGLELVKEIRRQTSTLPIFFLTAMTEEEARISGYQAGADAYLSKLISAQELMLRIDVFLRRMRRVQGRPLEVYRFGYGYDFYFSDYTIYTQKSKIVIREKEALLLKYFVDHPNTALRREDIGQDVWKKYDYNVSRSMDVLVTKIRHLFNDCPSVKLHSLPRYGFTFKVAHMEFVQDGKLLKEVSTTNCSYHKQRASVRRYPNSIHPGTFNR